MPGSAPSAVDFLHAHDVCDLLARDLEIGFQIAGPSMSREDAVKHFKRREALIIVKLMLLDQGERLTPKQQT